MTRDEALKATNVLAELEAIERAIDALPHISEFEDLEPPVYDKLYTVLKEAKADVEKKLEVLWKRQKQCLDQQIQDILYKK